MIINRISELKQAGVWRDFTAPANIKFAPRTLIYGFNGSGKTTLSRIFSSMQHGVLEERLPKETTFKIEMSDGTDATEGSLANPLENNLLVFNTDFVARNFQWDTSSTKGIVYLSEKKVDAKKEFDENAPKLVSASQNTTEAIRASDKAVKAISDFKTRVARNIREVVSSSAYTQSYDARKIQKHYTETVFSAEMQLSRPELDRNQSLLAQHEPLPELSFQLKMPDGLFDWFRYSQELLQKSLSGIATSEFEAHTDALRWVEEGLHYHEAHELEDCLFCGNSLLGDRRAQLKSLFDKSWTDALNALQNSISKGRDFQRDLREIYAAIPKDSEVMIDERQAYAEDRKSLEIALKDIGVCTGELLNGLEAKATNPTKEVVVTGQIIDFDLDNWIDGYALIEQVISAALKKHNDAFKSFSKLQNDAFSKIEAHVLSTNQKEWTRLHKSADNAMSAHEQAKRGEKKIADRQMELRNDLQDHGIGADKLNELIWAYLGHKELRLVAEEGGYKIIRPSGQAAMELSEGERTAVSFCYFLTQLGAEGRNLKNLVLVIDDPISSLDTAARTYAYSLMMRMTKKCAQIVILTHNTSFMNMVKREFQNLQRREEAKQVMSLLTLDCRTTGEGEDRSTVLAPMHELLVKYDSEYHYLFHLVRKAADEGTTDYHFFLPNATRKLLEMFATFCSPGQSSFVGALMDHHEAVKDKIDLRALERLVQIESHGTIDGLGSLPDLTLEEAQRAANASIIFIKVVAKDHYKKMCKACG